MNEKRKEGLPYFYVQAYWTSDFVNDAIDNPGEYTRKTREETIFEKDLLAKPMIDWIAIPLYLINDLWTNITKKCIFFWEINTNSQ